VRDKEGKPCRVRYEQVNAMLLNEFLKAPRKIEEQEAMIAQQQKQIEALTSGLQKLSAQLATASPSRGGLGTSTCYPNGLKQSIEVAPATIAHRCPSVRLLRRR
jgi:hypothetical protein